MLREAKPKIQDSEIRGLVDQLIPILEQHHTLAMNQQAESKSASE